MKKITQENISIPWYDALQNTARKGSTLTLKKHENKYDSN